MSVDALLLGTPGRLPFVGHLRASAEGGRAWLRAAGRVFAGGDPVAAYEPARQVAAAILGIDTRGDRNALLWRAWEAVGALDPSVLGPEEGGDLSLLLVAGDPDGVGVAGVGLTAVWGRVPGLGALVPLVGGRHPLLAPPGRPVRTPGVLTLDPIDGRDPVSVVGCPAPDAPAIAILEGLDARCGVRP